MDRTIELNGINVSQLQRLKKIAEKDPTRADRDPTLVAHWEGGSRSRIEFEDIVTHIGGEGRLNPMQMLLASLAACDVDLIAVHASLLGLEIESLSVEARGHFNVQSYLGFEKAPGSGYDGITYTVRLRAPGITPEQIAYLRERCERSSPVGDSLERAIPLTLVFEPEP